MFGLTDAPRSAQQRARPSLCSWAVEAPEMVHGEYLMSVRVVVDAILS